MTMHFCQLWKLKDKQVCVSTLTNNMFLKVTIQACRAVVSHYFDHLPQVMFYHCPSVSREVSDLLNDLASAN